YLHVVNHYPTTYNINSFPTRRSSDLVDKHFGTMEDFKHLIDEAHKRDIKVILEMVTNYVGETNDIVTDNPDWLDGQATDENIPWMEDVNVLDQSNASVAE